MEEIKTKVMEKYEFDEAIESILVALLGICGPLDSFARIDVDCFSTEFLSTSAKISIETVSKQVKLVNMEKYEFGYPIVF